MGWMRKREIEREEEGEVGLSVEDEEALERFDFEWQDYLWESEGREMGEEERWEDDNWGDEMLEWEDEIREEDEWSEWEWVVFLGLG